MNFRIDNVGMLFGLIALAIPIVLHLLQRRRFDVVDWGAMQFLPDSVAAQRKRWVDEILLLLLRMALISVIVLALATPFTTSAWLAPLGDRATRDVVLVFDGSYSMGARPTDHVSAWEESIRWAKDQLDRASRGDRFAVMIARQPPLVWSDTFLGDTAELQAKLETMPVPRGNPDMPAALTEAWRMLQTSTATVQEIIVLTDRQQHGWADPATLARLDNLGNQWHADAQLAKADGRAVPSLRIVPVGTLKPASDKPMPNYALAPISTARSVARVGQTITFRSALHLDGITTFTRPRKIQVSVDGAVTQTLALPEKVTLKQGQIPLTFHHRFERLGMHRITLTCNVDPAVDVLPTDNEQSLVMDVVKDLPILLVDGDKRLSTESSSFFLQRAFAVGKTSPPSVPVDELKTTTIFPENSQRTKPSVIVLADVPRLDPRQVEALDRYVAEGGGMFVVLGERMSRERAFYNDQLYRNGQGWLPAPIGEVAFAKAGIQPDPRTFQHPALEIFRTAGDGPLAQVRFMRWLKLDLSPKDRATPIGLLSNGDPLLVEKPYQRGRVIVCTVPLDRRWDSTLPSAWEFPILMHEFAYYLASSRQATTMLQAGAPLRLESANDESKRISLQTPENPRTTIDINRWPWVYANTGAIGVYQIESDGNAEQKKIWVVPPDLRESQLQVCIDADWRKVRDRLSTVWHDGTGDDSSVASSENRREDLWWLLLLAVLGLLCTEVWMTRRMVLARGR